MDDRLRLIRYLYDEEVDESALARRLSDDPDLYREYEELAATKRALDDRPARRPVVQRPPRSGPLLGLAGEGRVVGHPPPRRRLGHLLVVPTTAQE